MSQTNTYTIDPAHSTAGFKVRHLMVSNVRGEFSGITGTVVIDPEQPNNSTIEATIDASTIHTRDEQRDAHLKSADFLDVANFPTITFVSKKVEKMGEGEWKVIGDLTIHGVTKSVTLDVEGPRCGNEGSVGQYQEGWLGHHEDQSYGLRIGMEYRSRSRRGSGR